MDYVEVAGLVILGLHGAAIALVNATETPAPTSRLGKAYRVLEVLAGIVSVKAKQDAIKRVLK